MPAIHGNIQVIMLDILYTGLIRVPFILLPVSQISFINLVHFLEKNTASIFIAFQNNNKSALRFQ